MTCGTLEWSSLEQQQEGSWTAPRRVLSVYWEKAVIHLTKGGSRVIGVRGQEERTRGAAPENGFRSSETAVGSVDTQGMS